MLKLQWPGIFPTSRTGRSPATAASTSTRRKRRARRTSTTASRSEERRGGKTCALPIYVEAAVAGDLPDLKDGKITGHCSFNIYKSEEAVPQDVYDRVEIGRASRRENVCSSDLC